MTRMGTGSSCIVSNGSDPRRLIPGRGARHLLPWVGQMRREARFRPDSALAAAAPGIILGAHFPTRPCGRVLTVVFAPATMLELTVPPTEAGQPARPVPGRGAGAPFAFAGAGAHPRRARPAQPPPPAKPARVAARGGRRFLGGTAAVETALAAEAIDLSILYEDDDLLVLDKAAGHGHAPRARQRGGHAGQRAAGPLPDALRHRRRAAAGHRPPAGQGHQRLPRRRQERFRAPRARARNSPRARRDKTLSRPGARRAATGQRDDRRAHRPAPGPPQEDGRRRRRRAAGRRARTTACAADAAGRLAAACRWWNAACTPGARTRSASTSSTWAIPILGDALYGGPRPPARQMLHAWKLASPIRAPGSALEFRAPLPPDFLAFGLDPDEP